MYLRVGPDTFKRHPINTDQPVSDDDYVVRATPAGEYLVVEADGRVYGVAALTDIEQRLTAAVAGR